MRKLLLCFLPYLLFAEYAIASSAHVSMRSSGLVIPATQECSWFAFFGCFHDRSAALAGLNQLGATSGSINVIDTSEAKFSNFQPGYFCIAYGPTDREDALRAVNLFKDIHPDVYAKKAC